MKKLHGAYGLRDRSIQLLRQGYEFWPTMRDRQNSEIVRTRLLGSKTLCLRGPEAIEFFYQERDLKRSKALPGLVVGSLFGHGAIHTLDGGAHDHRKGMFTSILDLGASRTVASGVAALWEAEFGACGGSSDLYRDVSSLLTDAMCSFVGVPLNQGERSQRANDMVQMVDGFASLTVSQLRARAARRRSEKWVSQAVHQLRLSGDCESPAGRISHYRGTDGQLLSVQVASVEIINLIRPTVAVSWFVAHAAHAYATQPGLQERVRRGQISPLSLVHELRRCYPFAPFLASRATSDLRWGEISIPQGSLVAIDIWGTHHDPRTWSDADAFLPERFDNRDIGPYDLIPQGGGDLSGHRCPGEDLTVAILVTLLPRLAELHISIDDLSPIELRRIPARPHGPIRVTPKPLAEH